MMKKWCLLYVVIIALIGAAKSQAATLIVPDDYSTIQSAINASSDGDTITVRNGTYYENIKFKDDIKSTLISENGPSVTIIAGSHEESGDIVLPKYTVEINNSRLEGFTITHQDGKLGGGLCIYNTSPSIVNCIIEKNNSNTHGGGIFAYQSNAKITGSTIKNNSSSTGNGGGVIFVSGYAKIDSTYFFQNSAKNGGAISFENGTEASCTNLQIWGNTATNYGGGIYSTIGASISIKNSTVSRNDAYDGGGVFFNKLNGNKPSGMMINSILYFNTAKTGSQYENYNTSHSSISVVITYCNIGGRGGSGSNIDKDPLFAGSNDYHLTAGSPCVNAGTNSGAPTTDIEGNPRVGVVDIGAYEYQSTCTDIDGDGYCNDVDCDDNDPTSYPGATEVCDNKDNDCNGVIDDGLTFATYYQDADSDGYGNPNAPTTTCSGQPSGYVTNNTDCNDGNAGINPGVAEVCGDGVDQNCSGQADEGCGGGGGGTPAPCSASLSPDSFVRTHEGVGEAESKNQGVLYHKINYDGGDFGWGFTIENIEDSAILLSTSYLGSSNNSFVAVSQSEGVVNIDIADSVSIYNINVGDSVKGDYYNIEYNSLDNTISLLIYNQKNELVFDVNQKLQGSFSENMDYLVIDTNKSDEVFIASSGYTFGDIEIITNECPPATPAPTPAPGGDNDGGGGGGKGKGFPGCSIAQGAPISASINLLLLLLPLGIVVLRKQ